MLDAGADAPPFQLPGVADGEVGEFALEDYAGESIVVLVFYPADFSPTCTDELCALRDFDLIALDRQVTLLGISGDSVYSHRAFAEEYGLGYPLLSDSVGDVAEQYGVLHEEFRGHPRRPRRSVFVLDASLTVQYSWVADSPVELPDLEAIRDAVEAVQDDGTAVERYRTARDHFRYGRSEFETARTAYEAGDWSTAAGGFEEALGYFRSSVRAFDAAGRFGSPAVADTAESARTVAERYRRAAQWYAKSADHYDRDLPEWGDEYRDDAAAALSEAEGDGVPDLYALAGG
ncbi:redoxin domain-containing protein [Halostella sp. JP-L12]|uniref:redoxin domain-containing protein n=1 Tax=Halostella TaxID=1843185 RepID=UPI000EF7E702|nr:MULTISPECIES: redoxin domain-containing protein [Halostella]NHN46785.1 redoxin domain-containing protein [Halostella sp. JP-L12]